MSGAGIDAAVADFVLAALTPLAIEAAITVSCELADRAADTDRIRATHVERARHAADAARRRYLAVDPANRLVADALEADWNQRLRALSDAQDDYDRPRRDIDTGLSDTQTARVRALAGDLPALWRDPATPMRERKRLIRLLVTDVTLLKTSEHINIALRLTGGQQHQLSIPRPRTAREQHTTPPETITVIGELLTEHLLDEAVAILNDKGLTGGWDKPFTINSLRHLCRARNIPTLRDRLGANGMLTCDKLAEQLAVHPATINQWRRQGLITGRRVDGRSEHLFHPDQQAPAIPRGRRTVRPA